MPRLTAVLLFAASAAGFALLPVAPLGAVQKKKAAPPPPAAGPTLATPFSFGVKHPLPLPDGALGGWLSGGSVEGTALKLPADAPAGVRWVRVATAAGVSAARPACVDPFPELAEDKANRSRDTPQTLPVPCVVTAVADTEARAFFRIPVAKGKPLTVEALARRLGSPLDPVIVLFHPDGRTVPGAYADDTPGLNGDCRVRWTPPADGFVVAEVRDSTYKGGPDFGYRLRVGDFPGATTAFPLVLMRGQTAGVGFAGPHVGDARPVTVVAPLDGAVDGVPVAPAGGWPVWVHLSDYPQAVEAEPNDTPATANPLANPGGVSARFATPNDKDHFRFAVAKGQRYAVVVQTHELNSPAEVLLRVLGPDGKPLGESDPTAPACRVEFTSAADGECVAACEHQNYLHGPSEVYHLSVRAVGPDFAVSLASDRLALPVGGVGILTPKLDRTDFAGPVTLTVVGDGLTGTGPADGPLGVTCSPDAKPGLRTLRLKATGVTGGVEVTRWASVAEPVRASLNGLPTVPPELGRTVAVGVLPAAAFGLTAAGPASVPAGGTIKLAVTLDRTDGFDEAVVLTLLNPPAGVTAKPVTFGDDAAEATLEVTVGGDAEVVGLAVKGTAGKAEAVALPVRVTLTKAEKAKK